MNRGEVNREHWLTRCRSALVWALSLALAASAGAVNLGNSAPQSSGSFVAPDAVSYRSSAGKHKVLVPADNAGRAKSIAVGRSHDYGSFQLLEVDRATADQLIASGVGSNADGQNLILFNTGAIDTTAPEVASQSSKALAAGKQLHLVQFPGPITPEWYARLEATGVEIVNAIPSNAYLVYGDPTTINRVASLATDGHAQWHGPYATAVKLQPGVSLDATQRAKSLAARAGATFTDRYEVQLVRDPVTNSLTESLLAAKPAVARFEIRNYVNLVVDIAPELLDTIAKRPDVISIAPYIEPRKMDERQNMILAGNLTGNTPNAGNYFTTLANWGLTQAQFTASGLVVDVTDDGVDRNPGASDPGTITQDTNSGPIPVRHFVLREGGVVTGSPRLRYKGRWGTGSTTDAGLGVSGHGQLNSSIIGGYVPDNLDTGNTRVHRDAQGFRYGLGVAPFVLLGNSVIFDPNYTTPNIPNLLSAAYQNNARISSNSWGANVAGAYNANAQTYDILVRDSQSGTAGNQQMLVVFSAGNAGPGVTTVGSPGSGKNVLTVGAAENVRSHSDSNGGNAGNTAGNDGCNIADAGADSANDMISFSSRGPTADGRVKPDIVAPGTHITGMSFVAVGQDPASPLNGLGAGDAAYRADGACAMPGGGTAGNANNFFPVNPAQRWYTTSSGTSHSAPAVSGSAALIYQQFINNPGYIGANRTPAGSAPPSPALVKAYLTNSARYLNGTGANDTLPSNSQGMGSANLGMAFDGVQRIIRDQVPADRFTASGQSRTFFATVVNAAAPLRVTLAYTDKEGATTGASYVNNLDLVVVAGGQTYRGNVFSGATSVTGGSADPRNNLESVFLPAGLAAGSVISIRVIATNIAGQADPTVVGLNQDFALVAYNAAPAPDQALLSLSAVTLPTGNGIVEPNECNDVNLTLSNDGNTGATAISTTLTTSTPGVTVSAGNSTYGNIAAGATGSNVTPFKISTASSVACGSTINLTQTVTYTGGTSPTSLPIQLTVGSFGTTVLFSENFDSVTAPALPAGWTTQQTGASPPALWATAATGADSAPNTAVTNGVTSVASNSLISPAISLPAGPFPATINFRHAWNFESATSSFDGGILEISTDGGTTYNNVTSPAVGATFSAGGYNTTLSSSFSNPLGGQQAWGRVQSTFVTTTLPLPASLNGQTIRLRWRAGFDSSTAATNPNWRIDSISITGGSTCTAGTGVCVASNVPPALAYAPTAGTNIAFTGVNTVGSTGNGSIAVTPSGGTGSGAAATSTVNGCVVSGADAASFAGAAAVNLSFVGPTTTPQSVNLTCTAGSAKRTATLACNETIGSNPATQRSWPLTCPIGCSLDINGDGSVTADKDAVLLTRYLLGFRSGGLIANVPLGPTRADAAAVESYIGNGAQFDVFGRPAPSISAMQDGVVLFRLMLGVPDTGLFGGIVVPAGATYASPSAVRAHVNTMCGTTF